MRLLTAILGFISLGLLSMALAKAIDSVPIAWGIGFLTQAVFRLLDAAAVKWVQRQ
jgi:hypothetical protein